MKFIVRKEVVLASESPRRKELLSNLGIPFQTTKSNVIEAIEWMPVDIGRYVEDVAIQKAQAVAQIHPEKVVIGADTIVSFAGKVLPKPANKGQAKTFLRTLSGQTHLVLTAVAIVIDGQVHSFVSETKVVFYELTEEMIEAYIATEDPYDKAGAYGIQSGGMLFVKEIIGDYYAVMGLPVAHLSKLLVELDVLKLEGGLVQNEN